MNLKKRIQNILEEEICETPPYAQCEEIAEFIMCAVRRHIRDQLGLGEE